MSDRRRHWEEVWADRDPTSVSWYQPSAEMSLQFVLHTTPDLADLFAGRFDQVEFEQERHRTPSGSVQEFLYGAFRRTWSDAPSTSRERSVSQMGVSFVT